MAFGSVGSAGTGNANVSGSTFNLNITASVGNYVVVVVAIDNLQTTDGLTSQVSGLNDTFGHTWSKLTEFTCGRGTASAGATVSVWYTKVVTAMNPTTLSMTVGAVSAKAATAWEFSVASGSTISLAGSVQTSAGTAADPASLAISGLTNGEYLFLYGTAGETNVTTAMTGTNYTAFTAATSSGGGATANIAARALFRILTGTGDTLDPTFTAVDNASVFFAIKENVVPAEPGALAMRRRRTMANPNYRT